MARPMRIPTTAVLLAATLAACGDLASTSSYTSEPAGASSSTAGAPRAGTITGSIEAPGVDGARFACVFLMGRRDPGDRFPELVKRLPAGPFPLAFELSAKDLVGVGSLRGEWHLTARLDADGDALAGRGDVEGQAGVEVSDATPPVRLLLDQPVTEDALAMGSLDMSMGAHGGALGAGGAAQRGVIPSDPHGGLPAGHPPLDAPVDPHAGHDHGPDEAHGEEPAPTATADGPRVTAVIQLPAGYTGNSKGVLFFFARANAATGGMPLAVRRVMDPQFPVTLELSAADVSLDVENKEQMMDRTLYLSVSLDADGNASTKTTDDLVAGPIPTTDDGSPTVLVLAPRELP